MNPTMIAFCLGVVVGVPLGIFLIGLLIMGREKYQEVERATGTSSYCRDCDCGVMSPLYGVPRVPEFCGLDQGQNFQR